MQHDFDPAPLLEQIQSMPFTPHPEGRYQRDEEGNDVCAFVCTEHTLRFCSVRRTGLPQEEWEGQTRDLSIAPEAGLLEASHVVFFPGSIVGVEYNHYGPRSSRLGPYLSQTAQSSLPKLTLASLLRQDVATQLDRLVDLRRFEFKVRPSNMHWIRQADESLAAALEANQQLFESPKTVELAITLQKPSENTLHAWLSRLKTLVKNPFLRDEALQLRVRGKCQDTKHVETLDLLKDQLISTKRIMRVDKRSRAVDSPSAFAAIREAYQEQRDELQEALAIWL